MGVFCCPWLTQLGGHQCPQHRQLSHDPLRRHLTRTDGVKQGNANWVVTTFCGQLNPVVVHHGAKPYTFRQPRSLAPESHPLTHHCSLHGCFIARIDRGRSFLFTSSLKVQVPPTACEPHLTSPLSSLLGFHFKALTHLGVAAYTFNVSTQVEEAGGLLQFQGQFGLCGNLKATQG